MRQKLLRHKKWGNKMKPQICMKPQIRLKLTELRNTKIHWMTYHFHLNSRINLTPENPWLVMGGSHTSLCWFCLETYSHWEISNTAITHRLGQINSRLPHQLTTKPRFIVFLLFSLCCCRICRIDMAYTTWPNMWK